MGTKWYLKTGWEGNVIPVRAFDTFEEARKDAELRFEARKKIGREGVLKLYNKHGQVIHKKECNGGVEY